jgi:hypothetical protein
MESAKDHKPASAQKNSPSDTDLACLGTVPLLPGEDPGMREQLLSALTQAVQPADIFEAIWIRDIVYHQWNAERFRKWFVDIVKVSCDGLGVSSTRDLDIAALVGQSISVFERVEGTISGLEKRRNNTIHEIELHRSGRGSCLQRASEEAVDAESREVTDAVEDKRAA